MHPPVQFALKSAKQMARAGWALLAFTYLVLGLLFWYLSRLAKPGTGQLMLAKFLEKGIYEQAEHLVNLLLLLTLPFILVLASRLMQKFRLFIDDERIGVKSNLPLIAKWIDWSLPLSDFNQGIVRFTVLAWVSRGSLPLVAFNWRSIWRRHVVRVSEWEQLDSYGEPVRPVGETSSFFQVPKGFFSWSQPKSPEVLQKQFESVPLIQALRQRGVNVPPLSAITRQAFGADLFSNKRLKQGVYSMIAVSFAATALHFFAAHDHVIGQPSWLHTAIFMATCMFICWFWLGRQSQN
jgi:hypothetical protein